jgi:replicative DNA helicase
MGQTIVNEKKLSNMKFKRNVVRVGDYLQQSGNQVEKEGTEGLDISGISSGFKPLDELTGGWHGSDLILIAGRSSMGKTSLAVSMMVNTSIKQGIPAAIFSLESSKKRILHRILSNICDIEVQKISNGDFNEEEEKRFSKRLKMLEDVPLFLDDTPGLSVEEFIEKGKKMISEDGVKIIMIDYIQLMTIHGIPFSSRPEELALVIRALKSFAMEYDVPIIALSQISRDSQGPEGKRPQLSDLKRYINLEEDTDMVCFVHRPECYHIYTDSDGKDMHGIAQIILAKNRNGAKGDVNLRFAEECMKFL